MQKDVIYIDTEDDITAIIGKVKASGNKIVALVPPKRVGVLQSVVNLKLLQKAASAAQKRVVLITNDHSLVTLASGVSMPVAKNLQSKPEVPLMEAPKTPDEEIIEGQSLPVGDFAASAIGTALKKDTSAADEVSKKVDLGGAAVAAATPKTGSGPSTKKKAGIPNFNLFRKRLFLIGGGVVVLIVFLVWALAFAPRASVTISAKTTGVNVDRTLTLDASLSQSDLAALKLKPVVQQTKKAVATEFDATGTKEIGNKASGTVTVRNCDYSDDFTLPAGTKFTAADGHVFSSTQAVTIPDFSGPSSMCTQAGSSSGKASVPVQAADVGSEYNITAQAYSVSGYSSKVDGVGSDMSGGTKETVKVVSQADVDKAKAQLPQPDQNAAKAELQQLFTGEQMIIDESFEVSKGPEVVVPAVGEPASRAKVTQETTFTLSGVQKADVETIAKEVVNAAIKDRPDQQVYSDGTSAIEFQIYQKQDKTASVRMVTAGAIGPKIDTVQLAKDLAGKRYGEIQALVGQIPGVENVDIKFSPFWVTTAPKAEKIDIKFSVAQ
ncbi:MAG TPA: hypothetical protein VFT87_00350 [Candidatus Saccharimonadales bacterium]|nr:hypothetical protein [Candidatus Saccharimonadales bacterium]